MRRTNQDESLPGTVVVFAFNSCIREAEIEFEASLVYIMSSRPATASQRDPVSEKRQTLVPGIQETKASGLLDLSRLAWPAGVLLRVPV